MLHLDGRDISALLILMTHVCKDLNDLAAELWDWCIERNIHLSISHVAGSSNIEADDLSRKFNDYLEWALEDELFQKLVDLFGEPEIDLFASRLNHKLENYVSFRPDPNAVDAFSVSWSDHFIYIFAPFSTLNMVLRKIVEDETKALVIASLWIKDFHRGFDRHKKFCNSQTIQQIDLGPAIDPSPTPTRGNFVHYNFLKLHYIRNKITHCSLLGWGRLHVTTMLPTLPTKQ